MSTDDDPQDWDWLPRRTSTLTRLAIISALLGVVVLIASLWIKSWIDDRLDPPGGEGEFTRVTLRPRVTITTESDAETAERLHAEANANCFVARSVNFPVHHEPEILTA